MPLMLHLGRWWGIRHAKNGKKYVLARGNCRCQSSEAAGTWWAGGVREGPYGWSPAHESAFFLQQMQLPPGRSSTRRPPDPQHPRWGCASCEAGSNSDTVSEWLWLYPTCLSRISPTDPWRRRIYFSVLWIWWFCDCHNEDNRVKVMLYDFWGWVRKGDMAGEQSLSCRALTLGTQPPSCEGRLYIEKNWGLEPTASISTTHGRLQWIPGPQLLRRSVSCTLSKFLTQNLLDYDKCLCTTKFWGLASMASHVLFDSSFLSLRIGLGFGLGSSPG